MRENLNPLNSCEMYILETGEWTMIPDMNKKRTRYPGTVVAQHGGSHRIFVFGGYDGSQLLDCCEYYDIGANEWTMVKAKMTTSRYYTSAALLNHTTVIICGGLEKSFQPFASCELFDLLTLTFDPFPDLLEARAGHVAVYYNDTVVMLGGIEKNTCEQFDVSSHRWIPFPDFNEAQSSSFGAAIIDEKIYVAGGYTDSVEVYDGSAWTLITKLPTRRFNSSAVNLDGKLVVLGGDREEVDVFDPATGEWSSLLKIFMITSIREFLGAVSF